MAAQNNTPKPGLPAQNRENTPGTARLTPDDAPVILGADPEKSAYTLWAEKRNLLPPEKTGVSCPLDRGLEDWIVRRFREITGFKTRRIWHWGENRAYPQLCAHPAHLVVQQGAGLTCRVVPTEAMLSGQTKALLRRHRYHCFHQMLVTGRENWYLALLIPGKDIQIHPLTPTREELLSLAQAELQFWQRIKDNQPPMPDGSDSTLRTLQRLYPVAEGKSVDLSPVSLQLHDYIRCRLQEKEAAEAARHRAGIIKAYLGNAGGGHLGSIRVHWLPEDGALPDGGIPNRDHPAMAAGAEQPRIFRVFSPEYGILEET